MPEEFKDVVIDQFKTRLSDHQKQAGKGLEPARRIKKHTTGTDLFILVKIATLEENWFLMSTRSSDFYDKILQTNSSSMSLQELRQSRPAYMAFKYMVFKHRIYQEIQRQKFLNYLAIEQEKERPTTSLPQQQSRDQFHPYLLSSQYHSTSGSAGTY
ncbi:hypothetical protein ACA910_007647 [Epithemia clementina (nom. ined.)]